MSLIPLPPTLPPKARTKNVARALGRQVRSVQRFRQAVRTLQGLQWVRELRPGEPPPHRPSLKGLSTLQRRGKAYERAFQAFLNGACTDGTSPLHGAKLRAGQWLRFEDESGKSWAQPDFYALQPAFGLLWLFETKLTYVDTAVEQLGQLYGPLLAALYPNLGQMRIVVCRDLAGSSSGLMPRAFRTLEAIVEAPSASHYIWNWRGSR